MAEAEAQNSVQCTLQEQWQQQAIVMMINNPPLGASADPVGLLVALHALPKQISTVQPISNKSRCCKTG